MVESISKSSTGVLADLTSKAAMKVLHVDDDLNYLKIAEQCLKMQGRFQVDTARSVEEAMEMMEKETYDAIISDYQMPGKDGLEFLKELRENGNDVPFIVFTGKGKEEIAIKALNLGADRYIDKHGDPETVYCELAHAVSRAVDRRSAQIESLKREAKLSAILESSPEAITVIDLNGTIIDCNQATLDVHGYTSKSEVIGKHSFNLVSEKDHKRALEDMKRTLEQGSTKNMEYTATKKDGSEFPVELSGSVFRDPSGDPIGFVSITKDITERKQMEKQLTESEEKYRNLVENCQDAIAIVDFKGNVLFANKAAERLTGYTLKEGKGLNIRVVTPKRYWPKSVAMLLKARMGKPIPYFEYELKRKDGTTVPVETGGQAIFEDGKPVAIQIITRETTERKKAEEEMRKSEVILQNITDSIIVTDLQGRITSWNEGASKIFGFSAEEMLGENIAKVSKPKEREQVAPAQLEQVRKGVLFSGEWEGVRKDGEPVWLMLTTKLLKNSQGETVGMIGVGKDFTERKKGEHALLESQQKFERLFKGIPEATAFVDVNDCVLDLNPRFRQLFGYSVDEARGKPLDDLIVPNDKKREAKMLTENSKEGYVLFETVRKTKDGSLVPVSISAAPISVEGQHVGDIVLYYNITGRKQTEETLRKSEEKYRSLFEDSSDGLILVDRDDGNILDCNPEFMCQTGRNKEQLLKMKIWDIHPSHLREAAKKKFFEVKQRGFGGSMELAFQKPSGETVLVDFLSRTAKVGDREVLQSRCRDITERRKAEQMLKESEEKYRSLVELAPDGMVAVNAEGIVTSANRSFLKLVGYDSEEGIVGKPFTELVTIHAEGILRFQGMFSSLMNGEPLSPVEFLYVRRDGTSRWAEVHHGLLIKDGNPVGAQVIMRDVSERKNAEKLIQENQQKFEQLFMSNPEAAVYVDQNERVLNVNPRFTELFGYSFDEVKGKFLDDFVVPEDRRKEALMLTQKGKEGYVYYETVRKNKKGSLIPVILSTAPVVLQGQRLGGIILYMDITERRNMIESLESSEKRLRILFESAPDGYYLSDLRGTFVDGNKAAEEITGYAKTELIGKSFLKLKLLPRSQILKAAKLLGLNAAGKSTGPDELVLNRKDGTQVTVEIRTHPVRIKDQRLVLGIARDITERKRGERLILENQQKFEHLFRGNPEATVFLDSSFHILDIGPRFTSLFGYTLDEIRGKHINDVVTTKNMMEEARMLDEKAAKGYVYHDAVRMRKDGSLIPVSISAAPILIQDQLAGYIGVYKDVSQLRKAEEELRKAMEGLQVMNEKLRVVGGLTRHDVNNKLTAVAGYTYLARNKLPGNSEVLDYLKQIEASIEQTVKIFGFAKAYEMLGIEELAYVDVEKTVDEAVSLFPSLKDIKVVNDCHGLTVLADSLLTQLFYNLVDNSLKYGEKLSLIRVSYEDKNDHLKVIYEDDGVGIPHAAKPKLFDEGYTTGKGSGYGLYLVKRMVEVYGWTIQETGIQGKGARFILTVPEKSQQGKPLYKLP